MNFKSSYLMLFENKDKMINLAGDNIEVVDRFSYLGDILTLYGKRNAFFASKIFLSG